MGELLAFGVIGCLVGYPFFQAWRRFRTLDADQAAWNARTYRGEELISQPTWDPSNGPRPRSFLQDIESLRRVTSITNDDILVDAYVRSGCNVAKARDSLGETQDHIRNLKRIREETGADLAQAQEAYEEAGWNVEGAIKRLGTTESRELANKLKELETLHASGMLTDEEHAAMRKKVLGT